MKSLSPAKTGATRLIFRILAGILAAFLLLIGLPLALSEALSGSSSLLAWLNAFCTLYGGIIFAVGARTGRCIGFETSNETPL
jgi:hypothetical protein